MNTQTITRGTSTQLYTIPETAERLRVADNTVYRLIASGSLKAVDLAPAGSTRSKTRIRDDDLARFIDARTRSAR
jgi:excisionase family DNA binding protein